MSLPSRRAALAGLSLLAFGGAGERLVPRRKFALFSPSDIAGLTPDRVGSWRRSPQALDVVAETIVDDAGSDTALLASYSSGGAPDIMVAASYHGPSTQDVKAHRPEVCYRSAGFELSRRMPILFTLAPGLELPGVSFHAQRGQRQEQVTYWTRIGRRFPRSANAQRWENLREGLSGVATDGLLMRFSSRQALDPLPAPIAAFACDLFLRAPPSTQRLMVGDLVLNHAAFGSLDAPDRPPPLS